MLAKCFQWTSELQALGSAEVPASGTTLTCCEGSELGIE